MRKVWAYVLVVLLALILSATAQKALADYVGPNRNSRQVRVYTNVKNAYTNRYYCTYKNVCGDQVNNGIRCSAAICQDLANGLPYLKEVPVYQTVSDPPATANAVFQCNQAGNNGWCRSGYLHFTANEPVSGYVITAIETSAWGYICRPNTASPACNYTPPDGSGSTAFWAESSYGDSSTQGTVSWKLDTTPPSLSPSVPAPDGQNGWYVTVPQVDASGSDATSGLAGVQCRVDGGAWQAPPVAVSGDGTHTVECQATDNAGNVTAWSDTLQVDTTPPAASPSIGGTVGDNGWYVTTPTVQANASDATSGVGVVEHQVDGGAWQNGGSVTLSDGIHSVKFRLIDRAGNTTTTSEVTVKVDTTPPRVQPSIPPVDGQNGWYVSPVVVATTGQDDTSGLDRAEVSVDGGPWQASPVILTDDGVHQVTFRAVDVAGNEAQTGPETIRVDLTPPQISFALSPAEPDGENGWYRTTPQVTVTGNDATSGVATLRISADGGRTWHDSPWTVPDGQHDLLLQAVDSAGNMSQVQVTVKVDTVPPVSSFATPHEGSTVFGVVHLTGASTDALSGVATVEISTDGGHTWALAQSLSADAGTWDYVWDTRPLPDGTYTLLARAQDAAGNQEHTAVLHVTVANAPPVVKLTPERWMFWENAQARITPNPYIPLGKVRVTISDPGHPGRVRVWEYGAVEQVRIKWDGRWYSEHGGYASAGQYPVKVEAWDIYGRKGVATGTVVLPPQPTATMTPTPTFTPTPTPTRMSPPTVAPTTRSRPEPGPTNTPNTPNPSPTPTPTPLSPTPEQRPPVGWLWGAAGVFGLVLLLDPRPKELRRLRKTLAKLLEVTNE